MGNSKQARFSRLGGTPHHANNTMHIHMTSAPATTIARTMRSTFMFRQGMVPSNQNEVRLNIKTLTPEIRQRIYTSGGKTKDSVKPPPPALIKFVKFRRFWVNQPLESQTKMKNMLDIEDFLFWDASSSSFDFSYTDLRQEKQRIFTIVKGTPYSSTAANGDVSVNPARDFCNTALDSSFLLADQPLAFRLGFEAASFGEPDEKHFVKYYPVDWQIFHPNGLGPYFDVSSTVILNNRVLMSNATVDFSATIKEVNRQHVDISFSFKDLNGDNTSALREGDISLNLAITQKNIYTNEFVGDPDVSRTIHIPNALTDGSYGLFMYTPPFLITDLSLVNGSVLSSGLQDKSRLVGPLDETTGTKLYYYNAQYPDLSGVKFADSSYNTNGIVLTLNHPFPTSVSNDWIESVKIDDFGLGQGYKDVSNLHIVDVEPYNRVGFDVFGSKAGAQLVGTHAKLGTTEGKFMFKMNLKIPERCVQVDGNNKTSVFFELDLSTNVGRRTGFTFESAQFRKGGAWKQLLA
jgi:hypothetical protein